MTIKVGVISLGCAKNLVDSEVMLGKLAQQNYQITNDPADAEVLIVNTCGFIETAKQESINTVLSMAGYKETGNCKVLILAGCLAQKYKDELVDELPEVDAVIGTGEVENITQVITRVLGGERVVQADQPEYLYDHTSPRIRTTPGYSAYIKVADGCDNCCSYCVIPQMRGRFRSRSIESIVAEATDLVKQGVREVLLIAQDTTRYGIDIYGEFMLPRLLEQLGAIPDLRWIRLLYCYPTHFTQELIDTIAGQDKICKYLDIPLQHCDDELLLSMNRRGNKGDILKLLADLRKAMPKVVLRSSFIVGLPGETEEKFQELLDFLYQIRFDRVGVFTYSREPGTPAYDMAGQVPEEVKEQRYHRAMEALMQISWEKNQEKIGQIMEVLIEGQEENACWYGRSQGDAPDIDGRVHVEGKECFPGEFVKVRITEAFEYDLIGEVINEPG